MPKMKPEQVDEVLGRVYRAGGDSADPIALRQHIDSLAKEAAEARNAGLEEAAVDCDTNAARFYRGSASWARLSEQAARIRAKKVTL